ncbi:hypothetical protein EFP97_01155 [Lactobacillus helveticus]|nr:hypothetical protein [Lactobacillus helveticus]MCT3416270.1 hypothetical protein [Lactobacillus helveticus]MCT3425787.1 hypothetical protein [Lactobacillus helveticus]
MILKMKVTLLITLLRLSRVKQQLILVKSANLQPLSFNIKMQMRTTRIFLLKHLLVRLEKKLIG